jgi:regulator of sigma E protease
MIIFAGPLFNLILAYVVFVLVFLIGMPKLSPQVGGLLDGYPAQAAGIKAGDKILKVDGRDVAFWADIVKIIHAKKSGATVKITLSRRDEVLDYAVKPRIETLENIFKQKTEVALIGIMPSEEIVFEKYNPPHALYKALQHIGQITAVTLKGVWMLITGQTSLRQSVAGPIGIFEITRQALKMGFIYVLITLGVLNVCLALFNLIPFPVLDGGHLVFLGLERLKRRPVDWRIQELANKIGFVLLLILIILVSYNDIARRITQPSPETAIEGNNE